MIPDKAIEYLSDISYRPGWSFEAMPYERQQDTIVVRIGYPAPQSDVAYAPEYSVNIRPEADFYVHVGDCDNEIDFATKVFAAIQEIECHEAREFFAIGGTAYDKPFHPHTREGMYNWTHRRPVAEAHDMPMQTLIFGSPE